MKKRISMLMLVLFVTTVIVSVPDVKAAGSDMSICAAENSQDMACGQAKCDGCDKKDECDKKKEGCDKKKEGCDKPKEGCDKSGEKKAGCGK